MAETPCGECHGEGHLLDYYEAIGKASSFEEAKKNVDIVPRYTKCNHCAGNQYEEFARRQGLTPKETYDREKFAIGLDGNSATEDWLLWVCNLEKINYNFGKGYRWRKICYWCQGDLEVMNRTINCEIPYKQWYSMMENKNCPKTASDFLLNNTEQKKVICPDCGGNGIDKKWQEQLRDGA